MLDRIRSLVRRDRLLESATRLIAIPSPTGDAGAVLDTAAQLLKSDGFTVSREAASHPKAPAVITRLDSGRAGKCVQFNGHLDVVHLPFVPPRVEGKLLRGSGSCDMKGGTSAAIEALRALRDGSLIERGSVLFVAHDLHEAPWGLGQQIDALIRAGLLGDAVMIPEPLNQTLPVIGRGAATWKVVLSRPGPPVHEVMRPADEPNVIAAGVDLVRRIGELDARVSAGVNSPAGKPSAFVGQFHAGEIYNQYPKECMLEGTRRWLPGTDAADVEAEFRELIIDVEPDHRVAAELDWRFIRGAFELDATHPFVAAFQESHAAMTGSPLPTGPKLFVDDGNSFSSLAGVPAITHGPRAGGQHTVEEWASVADLVRVAHLYALTATLYCPGTEGAATGSQG